MRILALIVVSVMVGAGAVVATDEVQEARAQEALLRRVDAELRIAELQLEIVRSRLEEMEEQVRMGLVEERTLQGARVSAREAEIRYTTLQLDEEEIRHTGKEPRNEPSAPLVGGRDFVTERLDLEAALAREWVSVAESQLARAEELASLGMVTTRERDQAAAALEEARAQLQGVAARMASRQAFVSGELSSDEVDREVELEQARREVAVYEVRLRIVQRQLARVEDLVEAGMVGEAELRSARLELAEQELALELARGKLQLLRTGGSGGS